MTDEEKRKEELNHPNFKKWFRGLLHETEINLEFTKVNGEKRTMRCTLMESMIPDSKRATSDGNRKVPENSIAVFDLDKQDWRSFRYDSIIEFGWEMNDDSDYPMAPDAVILEEETHENE